MERFKAISSLGYLKPDCQIKINAEKCIACYYCAFICRCNVVLDNLQIDQPPLLAYPEECCYCGSCMEECPTGAIQVENPPPRTAVPAVYLQEARTITLKASEVEYVARSVVRVKLVKEDDAIPAFRTGSFCNVKVTDDKYRGYSISHPYNEQYVELFIDLNPNGPGSQFFSALRTGQIVEVALPFGRFIYQPRATPVLFIGSSAGISPMKAFLEQELFKDKSGRKINLLFQVEEEEDQFLLHYFAKLSHEFASFAYNVFFSKPQLAAKGKPNISINEFIRASDIIDRNMDAYICGSPDFIKNLERSLILRGVFWRNIFYESFIT